MDTLLHACPAVSEEEEKLTLKLTTPADGRILGAPARGFLRA